MHDVIGFPGTVHAQHAQPFRARGRERAQAHQGRCHGETRQVHQLAQQRRRFRTRIDQAAAGVEDGLFRSRHHLHRLHDRRQVGIGLGTIGPVMDRLRTHIAAALELDVLGDVDNHRTGAARGRDLEGFVQDAAQIADILHQPVVLGAGAGDADRIAFLESVRADQVRGHLARQNDQRNGIHQGVGEAGHGVGRARTRRDQHHARLAGGPRITFGGMHRALFVAHQNVGDALDLEQRVIDRQHRAAGIPKDVGDALILERTDDHLRPGHGLGAFSGLGRLCQCVVLVHRPVLESPMLANPPKIKGRFRPLSAWPPCPKRSVSFAGCAAGLLRALRSWRRNLGMLRRGVKQFHEETSPYCVIILLFDGSYQI